ncbi:MAG: sphingomyelin phosphodiesterase [Flavobacteriales bacterium]|nr:sphingomyelin phosphodiesterase [Flavobacteriales bacterium]
MRLLLLFIFFPFLFSSTTAQPKPMHVLTWNIYMRPHSITFDGQFRRAKAIGELLKKEHYDIILFQEAFGKTSRKKLRKALGGAYPYEIEPKNNKKTVNNGLWVLSKHPISNSEIIFFEGCLVSDCQSAKGAVLFDVNINGQGYQFVNTHLQAEDGKEFALVRADQFEMINQLLQKNQKPQVPQFILGDLNTAFKVKEEYDSMLVTLNATDGKVSVLEASELSVSEPITWGCKNNDLIKNKWKGQVQLLDYALQRETGYPFKLRRELKTYTQQWSKKRKHLSDHYAISLTILP